MTPLPPHVIRKPRRCDWLLAAGVAAIILTALLVLLTAGSDRDAATRKAIRLHVAAHPRCECCGLGRIHGFRPDVHHLCPYHTAGGWPIRAEDTNLVTLCRSCHWMCGHGGRGWGYVCTNTPEIIGAVRRVVRPDNAPP